MCNPRTAIAVTIALIVVSWTSWLMPAQDTDLFEVVEAVLCERVEGRECVAPKATERGFSENVGQVCLLTRIRTEMEVGTFHIWYHRDRLQEQNVSESEVVERFFRLLREAGEESEKVVVKLPGLEGLGFGIRLRVQPSSGYRTWSCKTIAPSLHRGRWGVKVMDSNDKVYRTLEFEVIRPT